MGKDYHSLRFIEDLPTNVTLVFNNTNSIWLNCTVSSLTKDTKLYWIFNNEILASDMVKRKLVSPVIHTESGYQLQLLITSSIPKIDAGTYTCVAANKWEKIERHFNIKFISLDPPFTIISFRSQEYMIVGADFVASCVTKEIQSSPRVFMFYSNTYSIYPIQLTNLVDTNIHLQHTTNTTHHIVMLTLIIKNTSLKNNGTYYCIELDSFDGDPIVQTLTTQYIKHELQGQI